MSILILGSGGLTGSAVKRRFEKYAEQSIVCVASRSELDLKNFCAVDEFFKKYKFEGVIICAARVGGIGANQKYPFEFLSDNLIIQQNIFEMVKKHRIPRVIFLGSSCIYPTNAPLPIKEEYLSMDGVHPLHEPYAIAKMSGFKSAEYLNRQYGLDCRCLMPTNLFGRNDNYHPSDSHFIPALIRKICDANDDELDHFILWGSGNVSRDVLFSDDLASAIFKTYFAEKDDWEDATNGGPAFLNVGSGQEYKIREIADMICALTGFKGSIRHDFTKPDGTKSKLLDTRRLRSLGWKPAYDLKEALKITIEDYQLNKWALRQ